MLPLLEREVVDKTKMGNQGKKLWITHSCRSVHLVFAVIKRNVGYYQRHLPAVLLQP